MEEGTGSLASVKESLDEDYKRSGLHPIPAQQYDSEAFDSMAVMNSEIWNLEEGEESELSAADLLPNGPGSLSQEDCKEAFLKAAATGLLDVVKELHRFCGPDILAVWDEDMYTPLHRASYNGHTHIVSFLITEGADVEARTVDGWQPLHCACRWNKAGVASLLLQNGAVVNSQTNGGQTPLHLASSNDRAKSTLELLLSQPDLDAELKNGQGELALTVAERNGRHAHLFSMVNPSIDYRKFLREIKVGD